jgi:hypothetical protein
MTMTKESSASEEVIASDILKTDVLGRIAFDCARRETILKVNADGGVCVLGGTTDSSLHRGQSLDRKNAFRFV